MSLLGLFVGLTLSSTSGVQGDLDAEIALDFLRASSTQTPPGVGSPETMAGQETGMRVRFHASELGGKLSLDVDYHGREPIGGDIQDTALRKLYRAEVRYATEHVTFGLGRFIAPSLTFLPIDGASADVRLGLFTVTPYVGRRAISTSWRNLGFDEILPAAGASLVFVNDWLYAEVNGSYSEDRAILEKASSGETPVSYGSSSGFARVSIRYADLLRLGGQIGLAQRADYVIGPAWSAVAIDVHAFDLMQATAFAEWRPFSVLRLGYGNKSQHAALVSGLGGDQSFLDNSVRVAYRVLELGWVRGDGRLRSRPDRSELRGGLTLDLDEVVQIETVNIGVRGYLAHEGVSFDDPTGKPNLDRTLWSASFAVRWKELDTEAGVSFIDRVATPISSRVFDPTNPARPDSPEDFSPFVLEAQRYLFVRAFYATEVWFAGLDFEENLSDASEQRFFVQLGAHWGTSW